tara:strand:- start:106 stop:372 length:267 start_codon:yes stop_codon:yes gene_type:complete
LRRFWTNWNLRALVDKYTEKDVELFRLGLARFEIDVAVEEKRWGKRIMCDKDIDKLKQVKASTDLATYFMRFLNNFLTKPIAKMHFFK